MKEHNLFQDSGGVSLSNIRRARTRAQKPFCVTPSPKKPILSHNDLRFTPLRARAQRANIHEY